jgi:hypothetical protein
MYEMGTHTELTALEFYSLQELGRGAFHAPIPDAHETRLIALGFAFKLLGHSRITAAGRAHLQKGEVQHHRPGG